MSQPPDKIQTPLVPNDDGDDPRITAAVWETIRRLAEAQGIKVGEPGEIDPTAKENPERQRKLVETTNPKLIEASSRLNRTVETVEHRTPSGEMTKRVREITNRTRRLSVDLKQLVDLASKAGVSLKSTVKSVAESVVSIAGRLISWLRPSDGGAEETGDDEGKAGVGSGGVEGEGGKAD